MTHYMLQGMEKIYFKKKVRGCQASGEDGGGWAISYTENDEIGCHQVDCMGSVSQTESEWYSDVVLFIMHITWCTLFLNDPFLSPDAVQKLQKVQKSVYCRNTITAWRHTVQDARRLKEYFKVLLKYSIKDVL